MTASQTTEKEIQFAKAPLMNRLRRATDTWKRNRNSFWTLLDTGRKSATRFAEIDKKTFGELKM